MSEASPLAEFLWPDFEAIRAAVETMRPALKVDRADLAKCSVSRRALLVVRDVPEFPKLVSAQYRVDGKDLHLVAFASRR